MAKQVTGYRAREDLSISGGQATTHLSGTDRARAYREIQRAKARRFLTRAGLVEVLEILGLDEEDEKTRLVNGASTAPDPIPYQRRG